MYVPRRIEKNRDEINTVKKEKRRAIGPNAGGFLMGFFRVIAAAVALSGDYRTGPILS